MKFIAIAALVATAMAGYPGSYSYDSKSDNTKITQTSAQNTCGSNTVMCCKGFNQDHGLTPAQEDDFWGKMGHRGDGKLQGGSGCSPCGEQKNEGIACCNGNKNSGLDLIPCVAIGEINIL
ncbi:hypothetical protein BO70DRAFT_366068 [Aspergillus heteromorphus CBS 117.55]|uniref:Hydrophobin n=1 Tax=Aspergillus heteromorphus CBS 117.55 TaxID=1448321 RepID=A0A317V8K2_9EURO|nr:uncharacterized protein BO70DRAFT_366068 [Aspergillus heteromorphus CBS 117.55]PWY68400.1 hypothetical protein BO70DRAFT_366068 [Aspergillus heteromorphus CBS 117.55]